MTFDLNTFAAKLSLLSADGIKIASAATKLYVLYQKLGPTAKASIAADVQAIAASWAALDKALNNYQSSDDLLKLDAVFAIIGTIATLAPLIGRIANDGETLFGADWPLIQPQVEIILNILKGQPA